MHDSFFRVLSNEEETQFRRWARDNWVQGAPINDLWHPVVRDEITKIQSEVSEK